MHGPVARQINFARETERGKVVALAVSIVEVSVPVPAWMIGIELLCPRTQLETSLPIPCIGEQLTNKGDGVAVHGVKCDGPLRCVAEALEFFLEKECLSQTEMGQMIGWL